MTSAVEPSVVHSELSRAALSPPLSTASNWSSVGEKANLGGDVKASRSCLKAVSTIHSTGKNIPSAAIHPSADRMRAAQARAADRPRLVHADTSPARAGSALSRRWNAVMSSTRAATTGSVNSREMTRSA